MLRSLSNRLLRISSGRMALLALILFVLFGALVLPSAAQRAERTSAGAGSPDTELLYSPDDLLKMADAYGADGRAAYVQARFTFDLVFPLVYGFFLTTAISWFAAGLFDSRSNMNSVNLVPVAGVLLDFLENMLTSVVMLTYPEAPPIVAWLASGTSFLKWIFVYGSFVVLGILILNHLGRYFFAKWSERQS